MKRLLSMLFALVLALGLLPASAFAAASEEEALGEINIFNGGYRMNYLAMNGQVQSQNYVYYLFDGNKEIPAYCVSPNLYGVQKVVGEGESVRYLAEEKSSDPKVVGIVASGYPTRSLSELGLENKYQGFYATKMALWSYLISDWDMFSVRRTGSPMSPGRIRTSLNGAYPGQASPVPTFILYATPLPPEP